MPLPPEPDHVRERIEARARTIEAERDGVVASPITDPPSGAENAFDPEFDPERQAIQVLADDLRAELEDEAPVFVACDVIEESKITSLLEPVTEEEYKTFSGLDEASMIRKLVEGQRLVTQLTNAINEAFTRYNADERKWKDAVRAVALSAESGLEVSKQLAKSISEKNALINELQRRIDVQDTELAELRREVKSRSIEAELRLAVINKEPLWEITCNTSRLLVSASTIPEAIRKVTDREPTAQIASVRGANYKLVV